MPRCPFHRPPLLRGRRPANPRHWKSNNRETSFRKATISTPIEQTRFLLVIKLSSFAVFRRSRNSSWYCSPFFRHVSTWSSVSYSPNTLVDTLRVLKFYDDRRNSSGRSTSCTSVVGKAGTNEDFLLRARFYPRQFSLILFLSRSFSRSEVFEILPQRLADASNERLTLSSRLTI